MFALFAQTLVALVIGHPVSFSCGNIDPHYGWYDANRIVIAAYLCPYLDLDPGASKLALARFSLAALVVTHEAEHAAGIEDEHRANCEAVRDLPAVLKRLKVRHAADVAREAARIAKAQAPPYGGKCK